MAVSDYTVDYITTAQKLADNISTNYIKDVRKLLDNGYEWAPTISPKTFLVGFKLLDGVSEPFLIDVAIKLKDKNDCNLVVANDLNSIRNGSHKAFIITKTNEYIVASGKEDIANKLVKEMLAYKFLRF